MKKIILLFCILTGSFLLSFNTYSSSNKSDQYWINTYEELKPYLDFKINTLELDIPAQKENLKKLRNNLHKFTTDYSKLLFLEQAEMRGNKYAYELIYSRIYNTNLIFNNNLEDRKDNLNSINSQVMILNDLKKSLTELYDKIGNEKIRNELNQKYLSKINSLNQTYQSLQSKFKQLSESSNKIATESNKHISWLGDQLLKTIADNLFSTFNIFNYNWQEQLLPTMQKWIETFPFIYSMSFPSTFNEIINILISFVIVIIISLFIYLLIYKKKKISGYALTHIILFIINIDFYIIAIVLFAPKFLNSYYQIAVLGTAYNLIHISRYLTKIMDGKDFEKANLFVLFTLYIVGMFCVLLELPPPLMFTVWIITLAVYIGSLSSQIDNKTFTNKRKITLRIGITSGAIALICILLGYLNFSIMIALCLVLIFVLCYSAMTISNYLKFKIAERNRRKPNLASIFIQGLGVPSIWISLIILFMLWLSVKLSYNFFYIFHLFDKIHFSFFSQQVYLKNLTYLIIVFFVFKSTLSACFTYMKTSLASEDPEYISKHAYIHLIQYLGWFAYLVIIFLFFDIYIKDLIFLFGGLSIGIGFALKHLVENILGGIILWVEKPIKVGDIIEYENEFGVIEQIGIRCTRLKTEEQSHIVWPNNMLISNKLTNWTKNSHIMFSKITVGIGYNSNTEQAIKLMLQATESCHHVLKKPHPFVIFQDFGDNALIFDINFCHYIADELDSTHYKSNIRLKLIELLKQAGISIPYPQLDINMKNAKTSV